MEKQFSGREKRPKIDELLDAVRQGEIIDIEWGEPQKTDYPNVLFTKGLGPCIGVGIYNKRTRRGYLSHSVGPEERTAKKMVQEALEEAKNPLDLEAVVGGGAKGMPDAWILDQIQAGRKSDDVRKDIEIGDNIIERARQLIIEFLEKSEIKNIRVEIPTIPKADISMVVNTKTGKIDVIEEEPPCEENH